MTARPANYRLGTGWFFFLRLGFGSTRLKRARESILRRDARCLAGHSLDDVGHVDRVGHDPAHVVFHQLGVDAGYLQLFGVGVFF